MSTSIILENQLELLDPFLKKEANELIFNRPKEFLLDKGANEWEEYYDERFDLDFLESFVIELATRRNQKFDERHPALSCELPQPYLRYRVQAQHKSILFNSDIALCIRIPNQKPFKLEQFLISASCIHKGWTYEKIKELIRNKKNVLVSGGTGTGKTSFLNSLMDEINKKERVVTIEDSQELNVPVKNLVQLSVPKSGNEAYSYQEAINSAMRLRPDRLFLGEIDIRNTFSFLRVNNTGHAGNLSTLHANDPKAAIKAIKANIVLGGGLQNPDNNMLVEQIITAIDYIVQIKREMNARVITDILDLKTEFTKNKDKGYFL